MHMETIKITALKIDFLVLGQISHQFDVHRHKRQQKEYMSQSTCLQSIFRHKFEKD